ncbi:hypothetical protein LAV84_18435 [Rhizobium sp. VS19-DR104.2]|uniref:hypothetical protein n=1 Tax=unclassified Rhizobium TaxID=2613769 RepID=UPI001CC5DF0F|nr:MULTISPECIES: hypothetical protein [unclassified Rhizobium]MBZ5761555.1 hypothetical protein [Rhizobium sp. VS19-DR96]MBZ5767503.1 hypothetical protein [Rhizobium sp. VS19-DR129.2]MBZ5775048.1 hypothetical protein [Rhizobium sp. VS19-DRK62.2]MBZ5785987.1 hypothetical protein [Rhizobium sp. VS19-DR121]MBZ5803413.1 hypothetical protein [Rhizobium sp. VS19-DR181]
MSDRLAKKEVAALENKHLADAKTDGFDVKEIKDYIDVMLSDDQKKHVDKFNMMRRNREKLGVIPRQAKDLFSDRVTREQQIDRDGFETGMNGLERYPRHVSGADEERVWLTAYDRGRAKYDDRWEVVLAAMEAARVAEQAAKTGHEPPTKSENPFAFTQH